MIRIATRHWLTAFGVALLLHLGIGIAVLWQAPESGAQQAGIGGIEISLGPAGGAPGGPAAETPDAEEAEAVAPAEAAQDPAPTEVTAVPPDPVRPEVEPLEVPQAIEPEVAEPVEALVAEVPEVEPVEAETPVVPIEEPLSEPPLPEEPQPEEAVAETVVTPPLPPRRPPPQQVAQSQPEAVTENPPAQAPAAETPDQTAALTPTAPGADGRSGTQASPNAGSANDTSGGGMPGAEADYMALLQAWLEKHKEYPRRAQVRRQQGTALLYFVMDRDGQVIEYRLQESSGYELLDREVSEMIKRAQPLPKMPDDLAQARLELVVPVQFFLR
ncbi:energy transducer TonB [Algihabitans albus]|uniref:energy transducer TonB n=1 Tax=Algihabitans albus TaxID=2164067 RepID=UPI000E5D3F41|nr:energy transducer TonB [Algihabitans albus]